MRLSTAQARLLLLGAQGLLDREAIPTGKQDVLGAIRQMEGLQIDTISVVARSPYLVLWSRLGAYEPRWLDELLAEGSLFEYWSRAACFLPIEDYGLYRRRMLDCADGDRYLDGRSPEQSAVIRDVLARIRENGAARSADFGQTDRRSSGWWDWKPEKVALEHLFNAGVLMIARRERFQRVYDLQERVLPGWDDAQTPSLEESRRAFTLKAVRALGVAQARWIPNYFPLGFRGRTRRSDLEALLAEFVREGEVVPVEVEGWASTGYLHRQNLALACEVTEGRHPPAVTTLLSPFDPIVCDRKRAQEMFGFDYRIETYTPAARRRHGYFSLPILHQGALVGRLDPKAHRRDGVFELKSVHLEPGVPVSGELVADLARAVRECAAWHQTPEVVVRRSDPPELASRLTSLLNSGAV
jgi:uncharacterized protein YcaQ